MKAALEKWHHWLEGAVHPFQVFSNHKNLEYIKGAKQPNPSSALFFTRFNFTVTYYPGSKNSKADVLSRRYDPPHAQSHPESILPPSVILASAWTSWRRFNELNSQSQHHPDAPLPNTTCNQPYVREPSNGFIPPWALGIQAFKEPSPWYTVHSGGHQVMSHQVMSSLCSIKDPQGISSRFTLTTAHTT